MGSSQGQQQPAVVYSAPHANRNAGTGPSTATTDAQYAGYEPPGVALPPPANGTVHVGVSAAPPVPGDAAASTIIYATYDAVAGAAPSSYSGAHISWNIYYLRAEAAGNQNASAQIPCPSTCVIQVRCKN